MRYATHPPDNAETFNIGTELDIFNFVKARAGYRMGIDEGGLSAGVGVNVPFANIAVDVAYTDFGLLGDVTTASICLNF